MSLFDLVKDPELAERIVEVEKAPDDDLPAAPVAALPVEIQRLRQRAEEIDSHESAAHDDKRPTSSALAERFVRVCLEAAQAAAEAPQKEPPDFRDPVYPSILRVVTVPLIVGDWDAVVNGRESAIEAVAALSLQRFASPSYRFHRAAQEWSLVIKFGY